MQRIWAVLLFLLLFGAPAYASIPYNGVVLDPANRVRPALLREGLEALAEHPQARRDVLALVDFAKPASQPRFFVIDLKSGAVESYRTAHGKGSDEGDGFHATLFSNAANSEASSLGAYLSLAPYVGKHGDSLALDGLDRTNSNARARAIVLHSASYMTPGFIAEHGRPGRSWGCFVLDPAVVGHVIARLKDGALIYAGAASAPDTASFVSLPLKAR